ncbi:MAG: amidohydrolase family protein [Patescibacteria group bacterium]
MIIDIHAHTSSHKMWGLHTEDASIGKLKAEAEKFGVKKIALMATYFPFKGTGLHNLELLERIKDENLFLAFGSLDAMNDFENGVKELSELLRRKLIAGIKLYPGYQDFSYHILFGVELFQIFELAECHKVPIMFHSGELHHCCSRETRAAGRGKCGADGCFVERLQYQAEPRYLGRYAQFFPEVKFIFSHLANPYFKQLRELMTAYPNVYTDISGQFLSGSDEDTREYRETIVHEIKKFLALPKGIDRLMFATDFPIQSYADSVDLIEALGLSNEEKEKIYWRNASRVLNIKMEEENESDQK